jgi:hypothetical protein
MQGGGARGAIFSATPAQGGPANTNLQGDKKFVDGGGIIVVHRGPKGILGPGPPYFTELAWANSFPGLFPFCHWEGGKRPWHRAVFYVF